ncbi:MAG TPA: hypothetical protein VGQ83_17400 [Polyangia bacterium]|jgi:hypothetical protein
MTARVDVLQLLDGTWGDGTRPRDLFRGPLQEDPAGYARDIVAGLTGGSRKVQNGCAELASLLSEQRPELLYPHLALFVANLTAKEPVLRWEAVCTIGNLVATDGPGATRASLDTVARHLDDPSIVLQGHAARALAKMARAFPDLAPAILRRLIAAAENFPGSRVGYVVEAMEAFAGGALARQAAAFVAPYAASAINPVATKARRALKRLGAAPPRPARARSGR